VFSKKGIGSVGFMLLALQRLADEMEKRSAAQPNDVEWARVAKEARAVHTRLADSDMSFKSAQVAFIETRRALDEDYLFANIEQQRLRAFIHSRFGLYNEGELRQFGFRLDGRRRKLAKRLSPPIPVDVSPPPAAPASSRSPAPRTPKGPKTPRTPRATPPTTPRTTPRTTKGH
jgi:hypothetical protein